MRRTALLFMTVAFFTALAESADTIIYGSMVAFAPVIETTPYDAEVEYIESTGTQWIDTGIMLNTEIDFSIDFQPTEAQGWERFVLGGRGIRFMYYNAQRIYIYIDSSSALGYITSGQFTRGTFKKKGDIYTYGEQTYTYEGGYVADSTTAFLPARNGQNNSGLSVRLFSAQIGDLDLIPVRFTNDLGQPEGAMFDRANPTGGPLGNGLYPNAGTGSFVVGPDVRVLHGVSK